jgi:hypothetical protein
MVIRRPGFYFGITLSDVERDMRFPLEDRDMEYVVDSDFAGFTLGGFHEDNRFLAILDVDRLVADSELVSASACVAVSHEGMSYE